MKEETHKYGDLYGLETSWYDNGQKWYEKNYKDGKKDGLETGWYVDGQKKYEWNYKDDELISEKYWNEK